MFNQVFSTPLDEVSTTQKEPLGAIRFQGGSWYKYCKIKNITATVAGAAGSMVAYEAEDGHANNHVVVDLTDADNPPVAAGALCGTVTGTAGSTYYGWVQFKGRTTVDTAITSGADGVPVYLTTTDKTLAKAVEADSAGNYKGVAGISEDASAKTVLLDCPW